MALREAMLEYTEDQILDNLIRAKNHFPVLHFDIDNVDAAVSTEVGGNFSGITGPTRPFAISANPAASDALTIGIEAETGVNKIYEVYDAFAPFLESSLEQPPKKYVHVGKRWAKDGKYYWVPKAYSREFYLVSLSVSAMRQENAIIDPKFDPIPKPIVSGNVEGDVANRSDLSKNRERLMDAINQPIPKKSADEQAEERFEKLEDEFRLQRSPLR